MVRHIFIATFKDGIDENIKQKELADMQAMKDKIPNIAELCVGYSTGWVGEKNQIVMTVDFADKKDFEAFLNHPYHADYINKTGAAYFISDSFVTAQFEL